MAAGGLVYTASFDGQNMPNAAQSIWEIIAAANVSILIHSIRVSFVPQIISGIAQDVRAQLRIQAISSTGTGGVAVTPRAVNRRNTVAAVTTFNSFVTSPGTLVYVQDPEMQSLIFPFERSYTPDQRLPVTGGNRLAVNLAAALGFICVTSSTIYFEEL
jgi:hypothetical protein